MDARRRSRWWQIRNYRVIKPILEALENVTRKFSFHHLFNALEWNKVSNQNCGLGRTHATRLGRGCCRHAKIVKNWLNATLRRLWIPREIRRCCKITLTRPALWNKVMSSNEIRIKTSLWSVWFSSMFSIFVPKFFAPKFWTRASWNLILCNVKPPKVQWSPVWPFNLGKMKPEVNLPREIFPR